ncbi:S-layer protein domain-containing protein [Methanosarcina sp. Z-7115]|uniref:S-layer protein domain-containing protein n=1 Tax=Methanosarcina baikalica TaxID=3073890 RepID=A0ABU2CX64_9EURY|nr:S-layer protein domain-containing protein [Methanosarcina sp. Z-7115]MDR7664322.1 S-layer protein domain-containing protein [Methanosarcina sp. Z-7115]
MADDNNTTSAASTVEIRGPVYNGSSLTDILANSTYDNGTAITMDANKFAAFYYDIDDNVTTESLSIKNVAGTSGRTIGENGLVYTTTIGKNEYKNKDVDWGNYSVIGFFADKYIPLKSNDASKLAKLVLDSDDKYTLRTGETLDLGEGYSLQAKQVDVDGDKVWLELDKDGQYVDDQIVSTDSGDHTWTCEVDDVQGEDNVPVLKVHVNQVFQGAVDSIAQIDGLWLIDYANAMKIESDDEFGKLDNVDISGPTITISNKDTFSLTRDSDQEIGQGLYFRVADSDALRFYAFKQQTTPGTYDIRGTVVSGTQPYTWTSDNFAGFFYDLNKNVGTETLSVSGVSGRTIPEDGLKYSTTINSVDYDASDAFNGTYPVLGFFAQKYVPLKSNDASKLAKLVLDSDDKYTLKTGETLDLGEGYSLQAKQVDVDGDKVWLELDKDGQYVDDQIVSTDSGDHIWTCEVDDVQGEDNVPVLKVHVNQVFQGAVDSIAQIDGLWLIDYANAMKIDTSDEFGKLDNVGINGPTITISNKDTFSLTRDSDQEIGQGMYFKVADSDALRYYPYIQQTLGNGTVTTTPSNTTSTDNTSVNPAPVANSTETPDVNANTPTTTETPVTTTPDTPDAANNTTETKNNAPGFEMAPAILGLLSVFYLVRKNR